MPVQLKTSVGIMREAPPIDDCEINRLMRQIESYINNNLEMNGLYLNAIDYFPNEFEITFDILESLNETELKEILGIVWKSIDTPNNSGFGPFSEARIINVLMDADGD